MFSFRFLIIFAIHPATCKGWGNFCFLMLNYLGSVRAPSVTAPPFGTVQWMVYECLTTWVSPCSYKLSLFNSLTALLYAPVSGRKPSLTEVGSLPDFFAGTLLFPVDVCILTALSPPVREKKLRCFSSFLSACRRTKSASGLPLPLPPPSGGERILHGVLLSHRKFVAIFYETKKECQAHQHSHSVSYPPESSPHKCYPVCIQLMQNVSSTRR